MNTTVEKKKKEDISIHPGVMNGRRIYPLTRSTKPNKKTGRTLKKVQDRYDVRLRDHADTLKTVAARFAAGFRKPGSRNPAKLRQR